MKFILSRKGMDSAAGGFANPILPNGTLLSLPIPDEATNIRYSDLNYCEKSYYNIISEIKGNEIKLENKNIEFNENTRCHFDPDLRSESCDRDSDWRGIFGQMGAAQSHLSNKGVAVGDVFLFFGWFRRTIIKNGKLKFDPIDKQGRHIIYGYMEIGEIIKADDENKLEEWMNYHPHADQGHLQGTGNTIYLPSKSLSLDNRIDGFGVFDYSDDLVLTKPGCSRSKWKLPELFKNVNMSYHTDRSWKEDYFKSTDRGQEFVIEENDLVTDWAKKIIVDHSSTPEAADIQKDVDIPVKDIISMAKAEGALEALDKLQKGLLSYLDDNGINPDEVDPEVKKIVGLIFKTSINLKAENQKILEEMYDFDFDIDNIVVKVPKRKEIL
jgi:hypothetical protein